MEKIITKNNKKRYRKSINNKEQKVQFGKYKGKLCSWVVENDYNYALWILNKSNSITKTKRAIQSLIDKKIKQYV